MSLFIILTKFARQLCLLLIVISTLLLNQSVYAQTVILRVDGDIVSAGGDGSGWGVDAFKYLQDALDVAAEFADETPHEIWVAATDPSNPYLPDHDAANPDGTGVRTETFDLLDNVKIYGGFNGTETNLIQRNPFLNNTVLSGSVGFLSVCGPGNGSCTDLDGNGTPGCEEADCCSLVCEISPVCCDGVWDNVCAALALEFCDGNFPRYGSFHVVSANCVDETSLLDGFTITGGSATTIDSDNSGGGMLLTTSSPSIVRCIITGNFAIGHGGGGMHITGSSNPLLVNCSFTNNTTTQGGAIHTEGGNARAILVNCLLTDNITTIHGGAIDQGMGLPNYLWY